MRLSLFFALISFPSAIASIDVQLTGSNPPTFAYSCPTGCKGPRDKNPLECVRTACVQKLQVFTVPPPALRLPPNPRSRT